MVDELQEGRQRGRQEFFPGQKDQGVRREDRFRIVEWIAGEGIQEQELLDLQRTPKVLH